MRLRARAFGPLRRAHAGERGSSLPELLVGTLIGAMVMSVVATTIFTTNDLRKRADDRSQFASDLSIASLSFDRDGAMTVPLGSAEAQTTSTSCATIMDLGFQEGGASVRYRTVASGSSGPLWLQRVSGSATRTIVKNVSTCTWQAVQVGTGRSTIVMNLALTGASGENVSQTLRAAPRQW